MSCAKLMPGGSASVPGSVMVRHQFELLAAKSFLS